MKIRLSSRNITVGDVIKAEQGFQSTISMVDFLARFVVDDEGNKIDHAQAVDMICEIQVSELPGLVVQLTEQIKGMQEGAVPLASGGS